MAAPPPPAAPVAAPPAVVSVNPVRSALEVEWAPQKSAGAASAPPLWRQRRCQLLGALALALLVVAAAATALAVVFVPRPAAPPSAYVPSADALAVRAHADAFVRSTLRNASGVLAFPYIVPEGGFTGAYDWDCILSGIATVRYPETAAFFAGSLLNFLSNVSATGEVRGVLTPDGPTLFLLHAKPMLVWGAYLAARAAGNFSEFRPYATQMSALLRFWSTPPRYDNASGCSLWYDMVESGADNLAYVPCGSSAMPCWQPSLAYAVATPDIPVYLEREALAYSLFHQRWAEADAADAAAAEAAAAEAAAAVAGSGSTGWLRQAAATAAAAAAASAARAAAAAVRAAAIRSDASRCLDALWLDDGRGGGYWTARNISSGALLPTRTYLMAYPLSGLAERGDSPARAAAAAAAVAAADMVAADSQLVRSLSSADALYTNAIAIPDVIGSNWRGPAWILANVHLAYALAALGRGDAAAALARAVTGTLAGDLYRTGTWHENYDTDNVSAVMGAAGFLSSNLLGADLEENLYMGVDPFSLSSLQP